jgi:ubiquinone/menaquinone biosynthesis C-methylase UbiE
MALAEHERRRRPHGRVIDIGCGAARNAAPLARSGGDVLGVDRSMPMLQAARARVHNEQPPGQVTLALAAMAELPAPSGAFDLVVAHGIWNLAASAAEFRRAVGEAARVAAPGAALFVFTFSRHTLPAAADPVPGEPFVFTQFSGEPQCFLTEEELLTELRVAGFAPDAAVPLHELNRRTPEMLAVPSGPVIWEAAFRRSATA